MFYARKSVLWNLLSPVVKKAWLVSLHYDNIKQVPPVFPNYVVHASISTIRELKDFYTTDMMSTPWKAACGSRFQCSKS